jgi:SAM-dependent methyltransferase
LDLASGYGRHLGLLLELGHTVDAVDRDPDAIRACAGPKGVRALQYDLEAAPWPYPGALFDGIIVTNYLYRPLLPCLVESLRARGVLIYETFAEGNQLFGRPSNPDFLLRPGELLELARERLRVLAYEHLQIAQPKPAVVQRICAVRED